MDKSKKLLYYSTNTTLSFWLGQTFYKHFFVWCSPVFDPATEGRYDVYSKIPPSSSPFSIYNTLHADVRSNDLHSSKIKENKSGLMKGASSYLQSGHISEIDYTRILLIIKNATIADFRPLVYIIPRLEIEDRVIEVEVDKTANPLSIEYQIRDLKRDEFEVIELRGSN